MCGIAGYSCYGDFDERLNIAITTLGLFMEDRGRKSWGWSDGKQVVKAVGELRSGWNDTFFGYKQAALHTRQPTTGAVKEANSHPFQIGSIIGMHNGIVRNHDELQKKYDRKCDVDSEHIFYHINENRPLDEISAYGAIVYWKDDALYLGRFNGGDLSLAKTEKAWVFASTKSALQNSLRIAGIRKDVVYFKLKEGRLYRLEGNNLVKAGKLPFASYCASYGTWENPNGNRSGYSPNSSYSGGTGGTRYVGYVDDHEMWEDMLDASGNKIGRQRKMNGVVASSFNPATMTSTPIDRGKQMHLLPRAPQNPAHMTVNQKIAEIVEGSVRQREGAKNRREEPDWKCCFCSDPFVEGEPFHVVDTGEFCCAQMCSPSGQ
jgi:hypothetical protein